jgi:hypothetical protein
MTLSTIQVLETAADLGLKLAIAAPDRLTYQPIEKCPLDFVETLKTYKGRLLNLLRLPFVMVFSETLGETIFFCADDDTRTALVQAGAEEWAIYTKDEVRLLVAQNRAKPFLPDELCKLYEIKRTFHGRIAE